MVARLRAVRADAVAGSSTLVLGRRLRRIHAHLPLAFLGLVVAQPTTLSLLLGALLVSLGLVVRIWASGYLRKGEGLCTDGPYRLVRHPLYLGSLLSALGFVVAMDVVWGWVVILPLFVFLYGLQMAEEERHLRSSDGGAYAEFARRVPALLPLPGRGTDSTGRRWQLAVSLRNREHWHVLFTVLLFALFLSKWRLGW